MPFIPAIGVIKATIHQNMGGQEIRNILHFHKAGTVTNTDVTDLAAAIDTWMAGGAMLHLMNTLSYNQVECVDLSLPNQPSTIITRTTPIFGGVTGVIGFPGNCAMVLTKRTAKSGRSFRGRIYVPGIPSTQQAGVNTVLTPFLTSLLTDYAPLIANGLVTGLFHSVASFFSGVDANHKPIARATGISTPVTALTANNAVDSQRRRLEGRGI